jgi:predicted amidophosphoribosyltransferase
MLLSCGRIYRYNAAMELTRACVDAGRRLVDVLLPPLCLRCGEIVAEPGALCPTCWPALSFIAPPLCACCGVPFAEEIGPDALCADCLQRPPRFRRARAAMVYDPHSRRLVLPFKHGDRTDLAKACGRWISSRKPIWLCRCRFIGGASSCDATIKPACWRAWYRATLD